MQTFKIEIIVPDDAGNDEQTFVAEMLELFQDNFVGNEDYLDSNVVISHTSEGKFYESTEGTVMVDFCNCKNKIAVASSVFNAIVDVFKSPEFKGMLIDE